MPNSVVILKNVPKFEGNSISKVIMKIFSSFYFFGKQKIAIYINLQLPIVILKKSFLLDMHHRKTYMYINFQQIRVSKSVKTVHANLFAKICKLHKLQLANRISKNHAFRTCTTSSRTFRPILRSISLLDIEIPQKETISIHDRRTDGRHDGRTDVAYEGSFIEKRKKY